MPKSTHAYPFERKVFDFARDFSTRMTGEAHSAFVAVFDSERAVRFLQFECTGAGWHETTEQLKRNGTPHLFFDPFDAPEYAWLHWSNIDRTTMERLLGLAFEESDFAAFDDSPQSASELSPAHQFPTSWGVMF